MLFTLFDALDVGPVLMSPGSIGGTGGNTRFPAALLRVSMGAQLNSIISKSASHCTCEAEFLGLDRKA